MFNPFDKDIDELSFEDIQQLKERKVSEGFM